MAETSVKQQARELIEQLPDDATWEDVEYQVYVRQAIDAGLKDAREGRLVSLEEARQRFGVRPE